MLSASLNKTFSSFLQDPFSSVTMLSRTGLFREGKKCVIQQSNNTFYLRCYGFGHMGKDTDTVFYYVIIVIYVVWLLSLLSVSQ